jgi:hypothetical protein
MVLPILSRVPCGRTDHSAAATIRSTERMRHGLTVLALVTLVCLPPWCRADRLYKWVDDDGSVHYSDVIPPQRIDKGHTVVDKDGVVVTTFDTVKHGAALTEEKARQVREKQALEQTHQKAIRDRQLLETYDTRDQLIEAQDQRLATIDGVLKFAAAHIDRLKEQKAELMKSAAQLERDGKTVSASLREEIDGLAAQIDQQQAYVGAKVIERERTARQNTEDLVRFDELKGTLETPSAH